MAALKLTRERADLVATRLRVLDEATAVDAEMSRENARLRALPRNIGRGRGQYHAEYARIRVLERRYVALLDTYEKMKWDAEVAAEEAAEDNQRMRETMRTVAYRLDRELDAE